MPTDYFGERIAAHYDESAADMFDSGIVDPIVDFLADLAFDGSALELGIGTGRIALPLAQRGVRVHGIDLSEAMVARLRAKPGAEQIGVTIGDFATATVDGHFSVAYLVFNTIMNLTTQDQQVACFQNAAAHLKPGGCFVIEVGVPDLQRLPPGETATRDAIASTKKKELLGQTGDKFELTLLLTQTEALSYAWHLAKVAGENESQPDRARALAGVSADMENLYREVFALLRSRTK